MKCEFHRKCKGYKKIDHTCNRKYESINYCGLWKDQKREQYERKKKMKINYVGWSLVLIGALIIVVSFICMQDGPELCSTPSILKILTSSFLTFGVGITLMMIGFAKLYADRYNEMPVLPEESKRK